MIFSRACENAIRATLYVATHAVEAPVLVRDIAAALDIPSPYLAKIIQQLTRAGMLTSAKGRGGGVALARSPEELKLCQVVEIIDGRKIEQECVLGMAECSEDGVHCALHGQWVEIRANILGMLSDRTIARLIDEGKGGRYDPDRDIVFSESGAGAGRERYD